jgi:hypothetical protein
MPLRPPCAQLVQHEFLRLQGRPASLPVRQGARHDETLDQDQHGAATRLGAEWENVGSARCIEHVQSFQKARERLTVTAVTDKAKTVARRYFVRNG